MRHEEWKGGRKPEEGRKQGDKEYEGRRPGGLGGQERR